MAPRDSPHNFTYQKRELRFMLDGGYIGTTYVDDPQGWQQAKDWLMGYLDRLHDEGFIDGPRVFRLYSI